MSAVALEWLEILGRLDAVNHLKILNLPSVPVRIEGFRAFDVSAGGLSVFHVKQHTIR